jgi:hypothetical protein
MTEAPFTLTLPFPKIIPSKVETHIKRPLSALRGTFADEEAWSGCCSKMTRWCTRCWRSSILMWKAS